jgi:hypothetical protein
MTTFYRALGEFQAAQRAGADPLPTSPIGARVQIKATLDNSKHDYWDGSAPGHAAAVARMKRLHEIAYPEPTTSEEDR